MHDCLTSSNRSSRVGQGFSRFRDHSHHAAWAAPTNARCSKGKPRVDASALAASAAAAVAATRRRFEPGSGRGTSTNSFPSATFLAHRRSVIQPSQKPKNFAGLTCWRTFVAVNFMRPHNASAKPIADALYKRLARTSHGTTTGTVPQAVQRYRRAKITTIKGAVLAVFGPSTCRSRVPCP